MTNQTHRTAAARTLSRASAALPDLRVTQLISNAVNYRRQQEGKSSLDDMYYVEDEYLAGALEQYVIYVTGRALS